MELHFTNGTLQQQTWFEQTMTRSLFPWARITTAVHVEFTDEIPEGHTLFAYTTWGGGRVDHCGRPDEATILIRNDLDDRAGSVLSHPRTYFAGKRFFMETVMHELGHVVQSKFSSEQVALMSAIFDGSPFDWNGPAEWEEKRQESFTETFKDVYLPRQYRKFDNRTHHRLSGEFALDEFFKILDNVCPCEGSIIVS